MSLFNIFNKKTAKQDELQRILKYDPDFMFQMYERIFESAVARASNLKVVGRTEDVKKEIYNFCYDLLTKGPGERATESDLVKIGFHLSFISLPDLILNRWDEFLYYWKCPFPFSVYLAVKTFPITKKKLTPEQLNAFDTVEGKADDRHNYYLISFPDPWQFQTLSGDLTENSACFFVLFHNHQDDRKTMYALKKSCDNKNALRAIIDSRTSGGIALFDYDPTIKSFLNNSWKHYLKCEDRRLASLE